ncbi:MAG: ATP-binding sensor histidine kinase [Cyanobacteria bacterium J06629_19]
MIAHTQLLGYRIKDLVYSGTRTLVYRGVRKSDQASVIIKVLREGAANLNQQVQFRNQYTIACQLNSSHIIKPLALERTDSGYALIIPDQGATVLSEYWQAKYWAADDLNGSSAEQSVSNSRAKGGHSLSSSGCHDFLTDFLSVAVQLAEALQELGKQQIIHKDIKPSNIIIHPDTGHVQLIDFSLSSLLTKEQQQLNNLTDLEGTLAYLSPEQTGRMNRSLDYRTDFYSLGVSFFELLTGQLPFVESDPMALLHAHLAKPPVAPCQLNPQLPTALSDIVLKLMAKNAEDRYQSALGLKHDLALCLAQLETNQAGALQADDAIAPFELATRDVCDRFLIPEQLYGRQTEVSELLAAFERVSAGSVELVMVAGFSGIGKTAVINEVHKPITRQHGYFIQGKFDQLNRNRPFSAFLQAFSSLIEQLLSESDAKLALWRTRILEVVGKNGQVLISVIPSLERILGPQPPVLKLSGSAAQNRFNLLLAQFVGIFATVAHPLVIFLDDLQWVDAASLRLLKLLIEAGNSKYLLILGAYRDNEVSPTHPLMLSLADLPPEHRAVTTLTLNPLSESNISQLVADTLLCPVETATPLAQQLYQKTEGNPFFTTQFLQGLHRDGWVTFEADNGYWQCDLATVQQLALTDDVVNFMVAQLQKLPTATRTALMIAACIGNQFDLATLAIVCQKPQVEIASDLWRGLQEGFVIPESEIYKFFQGESREKRRVDEGLVGYRFLHDRVQQAAYALILEDQKQSTHWQIGQRLLQASLSESSSSESSSSNNSPSDNGSSGNSSSKVISEAVADSALFEVVEQLNAGASLATTEQDRSLLIQLNTLAGQQAKASTAYSAALAYFHQANRLLPANSWEHNYEFTLSLKSNTIEAAYLNHSLASVSALVEEVLNTGRNLLDKIKVYEIQIQAAIGDNQLITAVNQGFDVLEQLGITLLDPTAVAITLPAIEQLHAVPEMNDPQKAAALRILVSMFSAIYNGKPELLKPTIWTMVHLCTTAGHTAVSPVAYSVYGMSMCGSGNIEEGYLSGRIALALTEVPLGQAMKGKVLEQLGGFISHWKEHVKTSIQQFEQGLQSGLEVGDIEYACHAAKNACAHLVLLGTPLEQVQQKQLNYIELGQQLNQQHILTYAKIWRQLALNLAGQSGAPWLLIGESFDEQAMLPTLKEKNNYFSLYVIYFSKQMLCYLFGQLDQAIENTRFLETYSEASLGSLMSVVQNFYTSLILLAEYRRTHPRTDLEKATPAEKLPEQISLNQAKMKHWADHAPMNHSHKYLLIEAEKHYALGTYMVAIDLYDQAIASAKANDYIQEEALANELAAQFWLNWGKTKVAAGYLQEAYYGYARWGAKAKTEALERKYPQLLESVLSPVFSPVSSIESQPVSFIETLTEISPAWSTPQTIDSTDDAIAPSTLNNSLRNGSLRETIETAAYSGPPQTNHSQTDPSQTDLSSPGQSTHTSSRGINASLDLATVLKASRSISQTVHLDELIHQLTTTILQSSGGDRCALILPSSRPESTEEWQLQAIATLETTTLCTEPLAENAQLPVKLIQYVKNTQQVVVLDQLTTDLPIVDSYLQKHQPQSVLCFPLLSQGSLTGILYLQNLSTSGVFTKERLSILSFLCTEAATSLEKASLYQALANHSLLLESKVKERTQELEQEVRDRKKAQATAEVANRVKSEFLANMSHELRSPLNAILGFSQVMMRSQNLPTEHRSDVNIIRHSGEHLLGLINDVLDMSKIEAGKATLNPSSFDLHDLLNTVQSLFQLKAAEKALHYKISYPQTLPQYIHADRSKLQQILINLLSNAFKFTQSGQVLLRASSHTQTQPVSDAPITLTFEIEDSGPGISANELDTIFEPFVQTASGLAASRGTGLGLSISRKFAQLMNGDVSISSPASHGSGTLASVHIQVTAAHHTSVQQEADGDIYRNTSLPATLPLNAITKQIGVNYRYSDRQNQSDEQTDTSQLNPLPTSPPLHTLSLSHLSPALLSELTAAAHQFQWAKMVTLVEEIRQQDEVVAAALDYHLQQFQYTAILKATQAAHP